jgi:hypothetical protein
LTVDPIAIQASSQLPSRLAAAGTEKGQAADGEVPLCASAWRPPVHRRGRKPIGCNEIWNKRRIYKAKWMRGEVGNKRKKYVNPNKSRPRNKVPKGSVADAGKTAEEGRVVSRRPRIRPTQLQDAVSVDSETDNRGCFE